MLHHRPPNGSDGVSEHLSSQYRVRLLSSMYALSALDALSSQAAAVQEPASGKHDAQKKSHTRAGGRAARSNPSDPCTQEQMHHRGEGRGRVSGGDLPLPIDRKKRHGHMRQQPQNPQKTPRCADGD